MIVCVTALRPSFNLADALVPLGAAVLDRVRDAEAASARAGTAPSVPSGAGVADGAPSSSIRFEQVSFRYPGTDVDVLSEIDLELRAGERTAIVGLNGAGKTTLVKLLCRFYEPTAGRILIDGVDLALLDPISWRARLAVLFQDFVHYELSARDNIRYGALRCHGK